MDSKKENIKEYYKRKAQKMKQVDRYRKMSKLDTILRIVNNLSARAITVIKCEKQFTHLELLGCSYEGLREHLQCKFSEGMTFDNYGEWEIDHIRPIKSFDMNNLDDVMRCFNFQNLQPLWRSENRSKGCRLINVSTEGAN